MHSRSSRTFWFMLAGPIIWAVHFLVIYSIHGIACARPGLASVWVGLSASGWLILGATGLALTAMAFAYWRLHTRIPPPGNSRFLPWLAGTLSLLSGLAVIWETIPLLWLPAC